MKLLLILITAEVPVGSIDLINSDVPDGWFKLHGASFDINTYPLLHAYLQGTNGYTSGKLPDWSGHYPGEYGDPPKRVPSGTRQKVSQQTAQPSGGARVQQVFPTVTLGHLTQRVEPMLTQTVKEKSQLTRVGTTSPDQNRHRSLHYQTRLIMAYSGLTIETAVHSTTLSSHCIRLSWTLQRHYV